MSADGALAAAQAAVAAAVAAPLSRRKAMLAALLVDAAVEACFLASGADDVLAWRAEIRARVPALAPILDLAAMDGAALVIEPVELRPDDTALDVGDVMVALYNDRTVPRVLIAAPDGGREDVHAALSAALVELQRMSA